MAQVTLGKTGIVSDSNGFGALPLQRVPQKTAVRILNKAYDGGINFYDTARAYSDSEEKIGLALAGVRSHIVIATKTMAQTPEGFLMDLEASLSLLKTDYIDIYQFHNPGFCPRPEDGTGMYEAMMEAKKAGKIRYIGLTNHRLDIAREAVLSGLYDTLQFPFSYLSSEEDIDLVQLCRERQVGFIAMKALSGGLITNSAAAYAFFTQFEHALPIWGVQRLEELDEFLAYRHVPPLMTEEIRTIIEQDKKELSGNFCRSCGYCMPCPVGIQINNCARMAQLIRRSPSANWLEPKAQAMMNHIDNCIHCNRCSERCPYGLDTPALLEENLKDYRKILAGETVIL